MRAIVAVAVVFLLIGAVGWMSLMRLGVDVVAGPPASRYIVQFDPNEVEDVDAAVAEFEATYSIQADIVYYYSILGFSAQMSEETASAIAADPRVLHVEPNTIFEQAEWGDSNCDGVANLLDVLDVLRYMSGLPFREDIGCKPGGYGTQG